MIALRFLGLFVWDIWGSNPSIWTTENTIYCSIIGSVILTIEDASLRGQVYKYYAVIGYVLIFQTGSELDFSCISWIWVQQRNNASQTSPFISPCWSNATHGLHQKQHPHLAALAQHWEPQKGSFNTIPQTRSNKINIKCFSSELKLTLQLKYTSAGVGRHMFVTGLTLIPKTWPLSVGTVQTLNVLSNQKVCAAAVYQGHTPQWMCKQRPESLNPPIFILKIWLI